MVFRHAGGETEPNSFLDTFNDFEIGWERWVLSASVCWKIDKHDVRPALIDRHPVGPAFQRSFGKCSPVLDTLEADRHRT
jgi:hypothetical protein